MSHFTVLVIGDDPEGQLAPFHEYECTGINDEYVQDVDITSEIQAKIDAGTSVLEALEYYGLEGKVVSSEAFINRNEAHKFGYAVVRDDKLIKAVDRTNPEAKWDWYQLGGRWTGFFYVKKGAAGAVGERGLQTGPAEPGTADQCFKKDIDFDRMRNYARTKAEMEYAQFEAVVKDAPWPEYWGSVLNRFGEDQIEQAREFYHSQPMIAAMTANNELMWSDPEHFQGGREAYVNRQTKYCVGTHAVIKDGKWYEKGSMGWWGVVDDEKDPDRWTEEFTKLLDSVPDDTLLSVYDCHI